MKIDETDIAIGQVVLDAHHASCGPDAETLFVDAVPPAPEDVGIGEHYEALSSQDPRHGNVVDTLWRPGDLDGARRLVVLSATRTGRELFRVLALVERLVAPGGKILLVPFASEESEDTRAEATEVFCGAYPEWTRRPIEAGVVELRKAEAYARFARGGDEMCGKTLSERGRDILACSRTRSHDGVCIAMACDAFAADGRCGTCLEVHEPACVLRPFKRVVSLAVFGDSRVADEHWRKMPAYLACWVRAHHALFPSYELRIHHDDWIYQTNYGDVLHGLQRRGLVKLVRVAPDGIAIGKCRAMLWRLAPAWDPEVSHVFCRDVDSLPTWRDRMACEEFVASGRAMGVFHDNPQHAGIMGGLCHVDARQFTKAVGKSSHAQFDTGYCDWFSNEHWHNHGTDQVLLNSLVNVLKPTVLEHSLFTTQGESGKQHRATPTLVNADFRTSIAAPLPEVLASVDPTVQAMSDKLVNYMGAAGFDVERALGFYNAYCPVGEEIRQAEAVAAGGAL